MPTYYEFFNSVKINNFRFPKIMEMAYIPIEISKSYLL